MGGQLQQGNRGGAEGAKSATEVLAGAQDLLERARAHRREFQQILEDEPASLIPPDARIAEFGQWADTARAIDEIEWPALEPVRDEDMKRLLGFALSCCKRDVCVGPRLGETIVQVVLWLEGMRVKQEIALEQQHGWFVKALEEMQRRLDQHADTPASSGGWELSQYLRGCRDGAREARKGAANQLREEIAWQLEHAVKAPVRTKVMGRRIVKPGAATRDGEAG